MLKSNSLLLVLVFLIIAGYGLISMNSNHYIDNYCGIRYEAEKKRYNYLNDYLNHEWKQIPMYGKGSIDTLTGLNKELKDCYDLMLQMSLKYTYNDSLHKDLNEILKNNFIDDLKDEIHYLVFKRDDESNFNILVWFRNNPNIMLKRTNEKVMKITISDLKNICKEYVYRANTGELKKSSNIFEWLEQKNTHPCKIIYDPSTIFIYTLMSKDIDSKKLQCEKSTIFYE
jgi:hypothetical protein